MSAGEQPLRFNSYAGYIKELFGARLQKVAVNAGFTCPNRDGSISTGGCTYCDNEAFTPSYCSARKSIAQQIAEGIEFHVVRYPRANRYLVYFQSFSNTYAALSTLKEMYGEALAHPQVEGIVVGTRPDCVDAAKLDYFAELAQQYFVQIEYGVESCYDDTLQRINRGHSYAVAEQAIRDTAARNIHTGAHFIFGLPGETRDDMLHMAGIISALPLTSVKFHQLQLIKGTAMAREYAEHPEDFVTFSLDSYLDFFVDFLEQLSPCIRIERFINEVPPRFIETTPWGKLRNVELLRLLNQHLIDRDTYQGKRWKSEKAKGKR